MTTLINDFAGFKELLSEHSGSISLSAPAYEASALHKELSDIAQKDGALYICDAIYHQEAQRVGLQLPMVLECFKDFKFEKSFAGFNIAVYQNACAKLLNNLAAASGAKLIDYESARYENGLRCVGFDAEAAYAQAAHILLDAYDNGADFMLVCDAFSMKIFDECSHLLAAASNRDFSDFYILNAAEFLQLASGKIPASLKSHKLKVSLV